MFDLEKDPGEQVDVTRFHPDIVQNLQALMEAELATVGEVEPISTPDFQYYLGPGRISAQNPITIEEALKRTRE